MQKRKNTLLWKIDGKEGKPDSFIFGTIHIWNSDVATIFQSILPYLDRCNIFAAESDLRDLQNISLDFFQLKDNQTLGDLYRPKKYQKLCKQLEKKFGISEPQFDRMSPFALYSSLSKQFIETDNTSLDEKLWEYAIEKNKNILGVESALEQMEYYQQIPMASQIELLYEFVTKSDNFKEKITKMLADYLEMDIVKLYKSSKKGNEFIKKILIYKRNDLMSSRIAELIQSNSCFIALGAGHLAGKRGILKQLKDSGYVAKPVKI
jgi:uncharacterized protein YbaP (TraB family)